MHIRLLIALRRRQQLMSHAPADRGRLVAGLDIYEAAFHVTSKLLSGSAADVVASVLPR